METLYNRDALKRPGRAPVQSCIYERGVRSQCCEIANTINVDLISFRAANSPRYGRICERSERGTKENDVVGRGGRERRWGRVLVTKEHVAAVDAAARKDGGWSGEFHNALVPGNSERRMIGPVLTIRELSSHRSCRFLLEGIPSKGIPRKSRLSKHHTSTIRYSWISRRITSNNVASELKIDFSPKGTAR